MRWKPLLGGIGLLAATTTITIFDWHVLGPERITDTVEERIRWGMTPEVAQTAMGSKGREGFYMVSGDMRYHATRSYRALVWADATTKVTVYFQGPRDQATNFNTVAEMKSPPAPVEVYRGMLVVLAVLGIALAASGFRRPAKQSAPAP